MRHVRLGPHRSRPHHRFRAIDSQVHAKEGIFQSVRPVRHDSAGDLGPSRTEVLVGESADVEVERRVVIVGHPRFEQGDDGDLSEVEDLAVLAEQVLRSDLGTCGEHTSLSVG